MTATRLTLADLNRATLARQMLLAREALDLPAAVERLLGVQAQAARPAFVGLWSRVAGLARGALAARLHDRTVVRATMMRGTLHLVSAADYTRFRTTLQAAFDRGLRATLRGRLDGIDMNAVTAAAQASFETPRTFEDVRAELERRYPEWDVRAMGYAARLSVSLVQVPDDSEWSYPARATFVSGQSWLGGPLDAAAVPDALVLRYLAAYGPSTVADTQAWLGMERLGPVFDALAPRLLRLAGPSRAPLFDIPDAPRPGADVPAPVRFLPEWDSVLVARADERFLAAGLRPAVFRPGLRVLATVLVNGRVAATWRVERKKQHGVLVISLLARITKPTRALVEEEGHRLLAFLEPDAVSRDVVWA